MDYMDNFLDNYIMSFYCAQVITIMALFAIGFLAVLYFRQNRSTRMDGLELVKILSLGFPVGVGMFMITGYIILLLGIPYTTYVLLLAMIVELVVFITLTVRNKCFASILTCRRLLIIGLIIIFVSILIATSGLISISVSNDSLYYFWQYPRAICYYGSLRDQFDNFLTDTGLGAAVIGTLPFLFGFGETFGIQEFFNMSFVVFFGVAIDDIVRFDNKITDKKAHVIGIISALLMWTCTSSYILAHWAMANMYFMEYYFIGLFLFYEISRNKKGKEIYILEIVLFACAAIRMEGAIFVLFMVAVASVLKIEGRRLATLMVPIVLLQSLYEIKIFTSYNIDNDFIFLTKEKAIIQFVAYVLAIIYVVIVRDRLKTKIKKLIPLFIMMALVAINVLLCIMDRTIYIANLKAFIGNLMGQSGWGILPYITFGALIIILFWKVIINRGKKSIFSYNMSDNPTIYWTFNCIAFLLITFAVAFARGDALDVNTGDSGNRVLLQITPLILISFVLWFVDLLKED